MTRRLLLAVLAAAAPVRVGSAQDPPPPAAFFQSTDVLEFTLRTDLRVLTRDRDTAEAPWRGATLTWTGPNGPVTVPLQVRTRGIFRLQHCDMPPIRLRFDQDSVGGTPFDGLRRPKLGTYCMDRDEYEQYVLQEYAIYRVQRLFTPMSYSVRLVRVTYEDSAGARRPVTRYGFVMEDPDRFAERFRATVHPNRGVGQRHLLAPNAAFLGLFQYFVGNTDWSVPGLHNIEVLRTPDTLVAVAYDFDWSGVISTSYARPDARLPIRSVRERVYRGLCQGEEALTPVLAQFEAMKDSIAAVYRAVPDLRPRTVEQTLRYYDEFYRDIVDRPRFVERVVTRDCLRN